jgi:hypothetical protein
MVHGGLLRHSLWRFLVGGGVEMPDESMKIYGGGSVIGEVIANILST